MKSVWGAESIPVSGDKWDGYSDKQLESMNGSSQFCIIEVKSTRKWTVREEVGEIRDKSKLLNTDWHGMHAILSRCALFYTQRVTIEHFSAKDQHQYIH